MDDLGQERFASVASRRERIEVLRVGTWAVALTAIGIKASPPPITRPASPLTPTIPPTTTSAPPVTWRKNPDMKSFEYRPGPATVYPSVLIWAALEWAGSPG